MEGIGATAAPRGLGQRDPVYPTEFLGCMIGAVRGDAVIVQRIAPVGMVHSQQWYLLQLRVLGAWWCLGSSALEPSLLLRYSLVPG